MAKTLLQLINLVGQEVRRSLGSTYTSSNFDAQFDPVVMTRFINRAKDEVEEAWDWERLRQRVVFTTVAGQHEYDTADGGAELDSGNTNERSRLMRTRPHQYLEFWDTTANEEERLIWMEPATARHYAETEDDVHERPRWVTAWQNGDGLTIQFPFAPSGARQYAFNAINPQDDLVNHDDTMLVPWRPVVAKAVELTLAERGEELGLDLNLMSSQYDRALANAIGRESHLTDFMMVPV